jgi:hypothetical protein
MTITAEIQYVPYEQYKAIADEAANKYWQELSEISEYLPEDEVKILREQADSRFNETVNRYEIIPVEVTHPNDGVVEVIQRLCSHYKGDWFRGSMNPYADSYTVWNLLIQYEGWKIYPTKYDCGSSNQSFLYEREGEPCVVIQYCEGDTIAKIASREIIDATMQE